MARSPTKSPISGRSFDVRTFALIFGAALLGAVWAFYNRSLTTHPYPEWQFRSLVWVIFATPFATFWGWFFARRAERWWAAFVCFCIYFFSAFVAARYESCTVVSGTFSLYDCFAATTEAQALAAANGHRIYFQAIVVIHLLAALVVALRRALSRSTMSPAAPLSESALE
jgi:hypothetical protein